MKKGVLLLLFAFASFTIAYAQSMLCTYKGGYFIRSGNTWYEYRPQDKNGVWATYTQYSTDDNYYYVKNNNCKVSIPNSTNNSIWIKKGNSDWTALYTTINIYKYCPERSSQLFTYRNGFFVKNGNRWKQYIPNKRSNAVWNTYTQYDSNENYYYIKNSSDYLAIPRKSNNNFYLRKNGKWETLYTTLALYDALSPNAKSGNNYVASSSSSGTGSDNSNQNNYANNNSNSTRRNVAYLDELYRYSDYDKISADLGTIVQSESGTLDNGVQTYTYYYDSGWAKVLYIGDCTRCYGNGKCNGFHGVPGALIPPPMCMLCGNTGKCGVCKGTGQEIYTAAVNKREGKMYNRYGRLESLSGGGGYSGGSGYSEGGSPGGYSGGSSSGSTYTKCKYCNNGVCRQCGGYRGKWMNTGYYTGDGTKSWIECSSCSGTGRCSICHGRGRL